MHERDHGRDAAKTSELRERCHGATSSAARLLVRARGRRRGRTRPASRTSARRARASGQPSEREHAARLTADQRCARRAARPARSSARRRDACDGREPRAPSAPVTSEQRGDGDELEERERRGGRRSKAAPPGGRSPSRASRAPGPPRISTTPNDVNVKRKTIAAAAAARARAAAASPAETAAADRAEHRGRLPRRGRARPEAADGPHDDGDVEEDVRQRGSPQSRGRARRAGAPRNAVATTTVGSTNGTSDERAHEGAPGEVEARRRAQASGRPSTSVRAVDAAACQTVNQSTSSGTSRRGRPGPRVRPRSRIAPSGYAKKSAEERRRQRDAAASDRDALSGARCRSTRGSSGPGSRRSPSGARSSGRSTTTANFRKTSGRGTPRGTGKTNIESGMSAWKRSESRKSTSFRAPPSFGAPRRTPASSTWRKQLEVDDAGGRLRDRLAGEVDLGRRARRVGDDDRPLALAPGGAREARGVRLLPAVGDEHAVRPQGLPVRPPTAVPESGNGGQEESEARGGGGRVLDHRRSRYAGRARSSRLRAARARASRTSRGRS